ncbi:MAG TPA: aldo/keto reductase [Candidatus Polarisedimenticolia bacterium]|nr:aldo/keto reductase [Candidatus Polarisedimenticolia bacterium]
MDRVKLPEIDVEISSLCLGVAEIGVRQTEIEAHRLLDSWVQRGGNGIDTARVYSDWVPGEKHRSERIVGDWLKAAGVREQIVLATKAGHPVFDNSWRVRLSPSELREDLEGSLKTLGTDYIDLWFLHRDDESIPVEEIMDSCDTFIRDGRVKALGAANWTARRIRKANDYASRAGKSGFVATQLFWNLGSRHYRGLEPTLRCMDDDAEQLHEAANLVAMPYSSQAGGFYSNWLDGDEVTRLKAERSGYATKPNLQIARLAGDIARRNGVPVCAVVLAFLRSHPFKVVPIIGCGTPAHLAASIEALDFVLSDADWKTLCEVTSHRAGWFSRYLWKRH